ncbi:MAG: undecaprenyl-diphosphate phosphatase [Actinobacteria bacterium]|nr:undecaprenyl-diphosphate phosphatase [Actinomycetota bacterium]
MLEAIFLAILQGLTEFLPISSSAHLRIAGLFSPEAKDPGATFTAIIQLGTELAVLVYFRRDISRIVRNWISAILKKEHEQQQARLGWLIIFGSMPILVFGFILQDTIRDDFRSLWIIASVLVIFGLVLGAADRFSPSRRELEHMSVRDGLLVGFAQALALIPGVSRSGATIAMCRILGFTRVESLRYSFLLAIPAVLASGLYELANSVSDPELNRFSIAETAVATSVAFAVGYLVIRWFLKFVSTRSFAPFVIYRVLLGATLLALLTLGMISA